MSTEKQPGRSNKAEDLLILVSKYLHTGFQYYPHPTVKIVELLLSMDVFAPRHVDTQFDFSSEWDVQTWFLNQFEIPLAVETYLSVIEVLLNANVDPAQILTYVPRGFVFDRKLLLGKVKRKVQSIPHDGIDIINLIRGVIYDEIKLQRRSHENCGKKRKSSKVRPNRVFGSSDDTNDSDGENGISE